MVQKCTDFQRGCIDFQRECIDFQNECIDVQRKCIDFQRNCSDFEITCIDFPRKCNDFERKIIHFQTENGLKTVFAPARIFLRTRRNIVSTTKVNVASRSVSREHILTWTRG